MKIAVTTLLLLSLALSAKTQSLFVNTYGTSAAEERAFDMVVMDDGSIITFGDRYDIATFKRTGYLLKVDANGTEQWNRQLSSNGEIYGAAICKLPNGNVLVSGRDFDVSNVEFGLMVAEYNSSNGLPVYQKTHEFARNTEAIDMVPMADNGAIILSTYETGSTFKTALLCRINSNGDTLWSKQIDEYPNKENPGALTLLSDGLALTGSVNESGSDNVFLIKTDMSGNVQWEETYPSAGISFANGIAAIPSGGFYIAGITNAIGNGGLDILGMKVDNNGQLLWSKGFGRSTTDLGNGVGAMPDGGAIFVGSGHRADTTNFRDLLLVRVTADGDTLWMRHYRDIGKETGYAVQLSGNSIIAAGKADVGGTEDVVILRADLNGNVVGINNLESSGNWNVYPNPFFGQLTIDLEKHFSVKTEIRVLDMLGRTMLKTTITDRIILDVSSLPKGIYLLQLRQNDNSAVRRIVKN
ncbi:MAG: T9SS type A sorting domain-containing protein [Flavobacteriales bacterium]|nr:T9SS type A sorting domain-containing protein [Flavobacteriales bacterium]